jgi:hypothetical protein
VHGVTLVAVIGAYFAASGLQAYAAEGEKPDEGEDIVQQGVGIVHPCRQHKGKDSSNTMAKSPSIRRRGAGLDRRLARSRANKNADGLQ